METIKRDAFRQAEIEKVFVDEDGKELRNPAMKITLTDGRVFYSKWSEQMLNWLPNDIRLIESSAS